MTAQDKLGTLTTAQRARKLARAAKLLDEAAALMGELYEDRKGLAYRMDMTTSEAHYAVGRIAGAVETAQQTMRETAGTATAGR